MPVTTVDEFFDVLQKSKLLTPAQMAEARAAASSSDSPTEVAKSLIRQQRITRWQAGQLLAGRSSFYLGKYRLVELLGRGGMGSVFLGQHVTMNRRVALKVIAGHFGGDKAALDRFLAEARAIAALDHPNIIQAYSVDNQGDRYYIVMEYVEGVDLQRMVGREGPLDLARAVDYIRQAAEGLDHAHQRHIIHCDVKPSNLLVNGQGVVKILDLGLARLAHARQPQNAQRPESLLGTIDYQAPEQALESPRLDARVDIYALGCTLYFLLTGHPPFPRGTLAERIVQHQTRQPPDPRLERPDIPADLVAIGNRMMAKNPDARYGSAAEAAQALADWRPTVSSMRPRKTLVRAKPLEEPDDIGVLVPLDDDLPWDEEALPPPSGVLVKKTPHAQEARGLLRASTALTASPWRILGLVVVAALCLLALFAAKLVLSP